MEAESNSGGLTIRAASGMEDVAQIAKLARTVWLEHYTPIIGSDQVNYMLDKFQSSDGIYRDICDNNYTYYMAYVNGALAGYCAVKPDGVSRALFLSKLYVDKAERGKGIAGRLMSVCRSRCGDEGYGSIWLTVNKHNLSSIAAYKRMGFAIAEEMVSDIGGGFVMDDYKMVLEPAAAS